MNNTLATAQPSTVLSELSSVPKGLQITHDVRLRQAQAEMLSRYQMAIMFPRDWVGVSAKLLLMCDNPDFARAAFYTKPAGGAQKIQGLSVRFAEQALNLMRNVHIDCAPEMEDETSAHYRLTVLDIESNTPQSETFKVEKTVERRHVAKGDTFLSQRTNSSGEPVFLVPATEEQFVSKLAAQKSKVKRTLILSLIPADVRSQCLDRCRAVAGRADSVNPAQATKDIVAAFLSLGIDVPDLKEYLGHSPASLVVSEIEDLRGIYALIRDGEIIWPQVISERQEQLAARGSRKDFVEQKKKERDKRKGDKAQRTTAKAPGAASATTAATAGAAAEAPAAEAPKEPPRPRASRRSDDDDTST